MRIAGHRGLPLEYPDNTLEGILAAARICDYVEIDVRRSSDGAMVLAHDPEIAGVEIATTDWETLAALDVGDGFHPAKLGSLLEAVGPGALDIEVKNSPLEAGFDPEGAFAVEVAACARPQDVLTCFFWPSMDAVRAAHPEVRTGLLVDRGGSLTAAARHAADHGHELLAPHWTLLLEDESVSRSLVLEFEIAAWTVDDPTTARQLAMLGIDSLISNDPIGVAAALGLGGGSDQNPGS